MINNPRLMSSQPIQGRLFEWPDKAELVKSRMSAISYLKGKEKETRRRKLTCGNLHLSKDMEFTAELEMPIVKPYDGSIPPDLIGFNELSCQRYRAGVHFFLDDYSFSRLWNGLDRYTPVLAKYRCVIAPDYSFYVDMSKQVNLQSLYKNNFVSAYWQNVGIQVIPTVSWGNVDSFEYCFDGKPKHSVLAIGAVGMSRNKWAIELFEYGISQTIERLQPTALMIYGTSIKLRGLSVPVYYYEDFINSKFRSHGRSTIL